MTTTAIILARAGSRGLPGKNSATIAGKPCAQWTIESALASSTIANTIVSTDDPALLELAESLGVTTIERPAELATDTAAIDDAARHAARNSDADTFAILYANVPVRPPDLIDRAVTLLRDSGCDSVQSYAPVGKHHPWWTVRLGHNATVAPWEGGTLNHGVYRRQDLPPAFIPDGGAIALTRPALFLERNATPGPHAFLGLDRRAIQTNEGDVIDIDSPVDLAVADSILSARRVETHA